MKLKLALLCIILIAIWQSVAAQKKDSRLDNIDTTITRILKEWSVPGVSISIVEKNKIIMAKGMGYRDYESKKPATENTVFAIGSCTKAFTASLIGHAIKDFSLDMDAPVQNYFPELKFYNKELTANVTVRDMLCHRTGLPRHDYAWYSGAMGNRDSMVKLIRYLEPSAPLRQIFQYNNLNYVALARLMEKTYQKSWEQLIMEKFFSPLSMQGSTTGSLSNMADYSNGYVLKNGSIQKLDFIPTTLSAIAPAGGIASTARDMANWLLMWTNEGRFEGKEIISQDFYRQAIGSQMIASANLPSKFMPDYFFFNYGLGWYTANYRGHYGVGHGGNINGFSSFVSFLPSDSIGVYVSVNQNNSPVPRILSNIILDKMIGAPYRDWNAIIKKQTITTNVSENKVVNGANPSHQLSAFTGTYRHEAYGSITIKEDKNLLTGTFNRWNLKIKHLHHNYFKFIIDADVFDESNSFEGEFSITSKGEIGSLKIPFESELQPIEFKRQNVVQSNIEEFKNYVGEYSFHGLTAKIYLTEANVLKAVVPGQPEYELIPVRPDEFDVKGAKGVSILFERDENGNVPACMFVQPNGKFRVTRISSSKTENSTVVNKEDKQTATGKSNFEKYVGEYNLGGKIVKIYLKQENLMAKIPGQPEYTLLQNNKNEFTVNGVSGFSVKFEENREEDVVAFTLTQPNGNVRAEKK